MRDPDKMGNGRDVVNESDGLPTFVPKSVLKRDAPAVKGILSSKSAESRHGCRRKTTVRIGRTRVGKGVFAQKWYRRDEIVGEIRGVRIADEDYSSEYCMDLEDGSCLEPDAPFRFLNHSCEPNCRFTWHDLRQEGEPGFRRRVFLYAMGTIRPEEELTIDYGWPASYAIPCRCGAPSCRGWVVAEEDLSTVLDCDSKGELKV